MALTQVSTGGIKDGQVQTADLADGQVTVGKLHADALDRTYTLGADGSNHYTFTGEGLTGAVNDPTLYLIRGKTYRFVNGNSAGAHPFRIQTTVNGSAGTEYNTGVTNNGGAGGSTIIFEVPHNAPDVLYYQCTSHGSMGGIFYITGALADGGVTEAKIASGAVTNGKLAADAVTTAKIANSAITNSKLGDDCVTGSRIADDAINSEHYVDGSIDTAHIANDAVTADKLADAINALIAANTAKTSGITMYNRFNNTTDTSGTANPLTTWSRNTASETGNISGQSNMSVSSGRFSFPSTGIYRITVQHDWYQPSGSDRAIQMSVRLGDTSFGSDGNNKVYTYGSTGGVGGYNNHGTNHCTYVVNISNTSTQKIELWTHKVNSSTVTTTNTYVDFEKIG